MTNETPKASKANTKAPQAPSMEVIEGNGPQMLTDMGQVQGTNPKRDPEEVVVEQQGQSLTVTRY